MNRQQISRGWDTNLRGSAPRKEWLIAIFFQDQRLSAFIRGRYARPVSETLPSAKRISV